jgi:hypothetical protein
MTTIRTVLGLAAAVMLGSVAAQAQDVPSLKGKRIGITVASTEHY